MLVARNSGKSKFLKGLAGVDAWRSKRPPSFCQRFSNTWKLSGSVFALSDQSSILRREWRMEDEWDFIITLYTFPHRFFVLIYFEMIGSMFHRIYINTLLTNVNGSMFFSPPQKKTSCFLFSRSARFHGSVWGPIASNSLLKSSPQIRWRDKNGSTVKGTVPDTFTYPSPSSARCFFSKKHPVQWREKLFEEKSGAFRCWWCFSTTWGYWLLLPLLSSLGIEVFFPQSVIEQKGYK